MHVVTERVAADIAARVPAMAQDSPTNNASLIAQIINEQLVPRVELHHIVAELCDPTVPTQLINALIDETL